MDWNVLTDVESSFAFSSDPGALVNPSFDGAESLTGNLSQWDCATSTCFDQFTPYNFVSTPLEDTRYEEWKLMDSSYNIEPTSSEEPAFDATKLDNLEKGLSQLVNGSGFEGTDSLRLDECLQGLQDCKTFGLDQVDDNFMNSLSDEDIRAMLNTVEPSQQVVHPCTKPETFEDILANLLNDPMNNILYPNETGGTNSMDAFGISHLPQDLSVTSSMISQGSAASDSSTLVNPRGSFAESRALVSDVVKAKIFEGTILRELEAALSRVNERTRICFRDACYRMANDSKGSRDESMRGFHFDPSFHTSLQAYKVEPAEKESNVIDRAIVNLLFNPPCKGPSETWPLHDFHTNGIQNM